MTRASKLRHLLHSQQLDFLMEAHSGLSARIVQEAGFHGIWASGLSISASLGVRDNNEASWTQVLEVAEFMNDAVDIPILIDADTGYGNFNNARRLVRKLEQRDIAGMCIEDKVFPKTNSFINGELQPLAPVPEFAGKIAAIKDTQRDPDFCVVARVEALIAGRSMQEALDRAHAYHEAGADAVLVHSKESTAHQILEFMRQWDGACPVAVVPTKYYATPTEDLEAAGISLAIWGNQLMRSSITMMQRTAARIQQDRSILAVESEIAPIAEVFRLQNEAEMAAAERKYLPTHEDGRLAPPIPLLRPRPAGIVDGSEAVAAAGS
jgi:phosphoenolpyruvate phosphomutase